MSARWWLSRRPPRPPIPRRKCALVLMSLLACHATSPHTNAIEEPTNLRFDIKHGNMTTRLTRLASSDQINPTLTQYPQRYDLRNTLNSAPHGAFPTSTTSSVDPRMFACPCATTPLRSKQSNKNTQGWLHEALRQNRCAPYLPSPQTVLPHRNTSQLTPLWHGHNLWRSDDCRRQKEMMNEHKHEQTQRRHTFLPAAQHEEQFLRPPLTTSNTTKSKTTGFEPAMTNCLGGAVRAKPRRSATRRPSLHANYIVYKDKRASKHSMPSVACAPASTNKPATEKPDPRASLKRIAGSRVGAKEKNVFHRKLRSWMRNHRSSKRSCRNPKKDEYPTIGVPPAAQNKDTNSAAQRKQPCGSSTAAMQDDGRNAMLLTKIQDRNKVKQTWAPAGRAAEEARSTSS